MTPFQFLLPLAILALCVQCSAPTPDANAATRPSTPLLPLYRALDALQAGASHGAVAVLQIGDSHTANDAFSGRMRELFQDRFGDAGRGMMQAGIPFRYYHPNQVTVTASGWRTISSYDPGAPGPFGLTGLRQTATGPAEMLLQADQPGGIARVTVEALAQPGGGTIDAIADNGATAAFSTNGRAGAPLWFDMPTTAGSASLTLRARGDGPVDLLSWTIGRGHAGITYSNLGTVSATIDLIGRWDPGLMAAEMARLHPALILVEFGTNEGFKDSTDVASYADRYAEHVRALRRAAPWAAIMLIGPPDGVRRAGPGEACPSDGTGRSGIWLIPPRLPEIRAVQQRLAHAAGYAYWDWQAAMGGACSILPMTLTEPPMAAPDHVHMFAPGYRATAETLFQSLMQGYGAYQAQTHPH
jgi:lysophospholipase L1-like esterase